MSTTSGSSAAAAVTASTPVDANQTETRFNFYIRSLGDEATNSSVGNAFADEVIKQFTEDMPIWEHKAYVERAPLIADDGPIRTVRQWAKQFYP